MAQTKIRGRAAVLTLKKQSAAGVWAAPSASTDAILVRSPEISFDPQQIQTDESGPSLDSRAPLIGGMQVGVNFGVYLKGSGVPGVAPEYTGALEVCGVKEIITRTDITDTDIAAVASTGKITSVAADITPLTVGTHIYVSGFATAANNGEFLVSAVGSGEITVTKVDGSAHGLVDEAAGASVTISRGIAGVSATAGSATTFTAQAPWAATADLYRFMPVLLSGNPATPVFSQIQDYTAGRVATLVDSFGTALSGTTKVSIPANVTYVLASTNLPWASTEFYMDGRLWQIMDLVGSVRLEWTAAGAVMANFQMRGRLYANPSDAALPAATYDGTRPGVYRGSKFLLNRVAVSLQTLSFGAENTIVFPPNPNEDEGFEAPIITQRNASGQMDPHMTLVATRDNLRDMRDGVPRPVHALLRGGQANKPGCRVACAIPEAYYTGVSPGDQSGLKTESTNFFCNGFDAGWGMTLF